MPGICGWVTADPVVEPQVVLDGMLATLGAAQRSERATGPGWAIGVAGIEEPRGVIHSTPQLTVTLLGRVTFASSDLEAVNRSAGPARALAAAYGAQGEKCFSVLSGAFAAVVVDHANRSCLAAIDRMGVCPLFFAEIDNGLVLGSTADAVGRHPRVPRDISLQSIFNYAYFHMVPGPETIFRGQQRIPPGGYLRSSNGTVEIKRYWNMVYREQEPSDLEHLEVEFRDLLESGVRRLLDGRSVGAFLSGGTDSSTVAGMLGRVTGGPAKTFSIGFAAEGYDEVQYARIAARHFGTEHHEYYVTPDDVLELLQRIPQYCDQPFGNSSCVPTFCCARLAKSAGVDTLLGGDGGDELFGGNERYGRQAIFALYDKVPRPLRKGLLEPALFAVPWGERITPVRKARSYVRQASVPMPARLHTYNVLNRHALGSVFTEEFLRTVDTGLPGRLLDDAYHHAEAQTMLNRMLALDLQFTLADNDLYKVGKMCELADVEVAYPMLDDDLVAFSAALPSGLKLKGTTLRYFFKHALRDFLPQEIIKKHKHGFGLPVGVWTRDHAPLRDLVYGTLHDFKRRGVTRPEFIDEMIAGHQSVHTAYWGEEIWVLAVLELWLQAHGMSRGQALL